MERAYNWHARLQLALSDQEPDFDVAELGRAAHDMIRGQNVYVPAAAMAQAEAVLKEAWGDRALGD